jgi:hypothetical protein
MIYPTLHLGGTSKDALLEALHEAVEALIDTENALGRVHPHGRDYVYVPGSYETATLEHQRRVLMIQTVRNEIDTIRENIYNQGR